MKLQKEIEIVDDLIHFHGGDAFFLKPLVSNAHSG
jgi:hypothetical protein